MKDQKLRGREGILSARIATLLVFATLLLSAPLAQAVPIDKIFTSSGQILTGEEWNNVSIYNDDTIVDMLGGDVESIGTYDASTINFSGGHVMTLGAGQFSTANVSGGVIAGLDAWNQAIVNFSDDAIGGTIGARDFGTLNMTGGTTDYLGTIDSGTINLYGGSITESLGAWHDATVNIYGYCFNYDPMGGALDGGQLTGFWLDDTSFTIDLYGTETYSHINLIPEPSSLVLFAFGCVLIRRKK